MNQCTNCGAALEPGAAVCPSCAAPVAAMPASTPEPTPTGGGASPAGAAMPASTLQNLARGAKVLALLFFLLPWVTISCAGQPIARITGVQLATGNVGDIGGQMPGAQAPAAPAAPQDLSLDVFALAAAALIVLALALSFILPRRKAALVAIGACAIALALIVYDVFVRIKGAAEDQFREGMAASRPSAAPSNPFEAQMQKQMQEMMEGFSVDPAIGFWLTAAALAAAIVLSKMVHGRGS